MKYGDLNKVTLAAPDDPDLAPFPVNQSTTYCKVTTHFRDLEQELISYINQYPCIVGCIAWLTNENILKALATRNIVQIIVQKEDFLRPDMCIVDKISWSRKLRRLYDQIKCRSLRYYLPGVAGSLSYGGDVEVAGVRCAGNYNEEKHPAFPRMHNKFLVFCDYAPGTDIKALDTGFGDTEKINPVAVWTGSFNFTENSKSSLENAVFIEDSTIASAYANEWSYILGISETLDWEHKWISPEYRIGS